MEAPRGRPPLSIATGSMTVVRFAHRSIKTTKVRIAVDRLSSLPTGTDPVADPSSAAAVCWHTMKRTTVKLPDELDARLRHEADRRGTTVSEVTRAAIESHLGGGRRRLIAAKAGRSGRRDTARRIEEILRREGRRSR